jgi:hypothetical protein
MQTAHELDMELRLNMIWIGTRVTLDMCKAKGGVFLLAANPFVVTTDYSAISGCKNGERLAERKLQSLLKFP